MEKLKKLAEITAKTEEDGFKVFKALENSGFLVCSTMESFPYSQFEVFEKKQ